MWGIIPAAGRGSRIQPLAFSKELLPVGSRREGARERPCAVSEYLLERMVKGGVDKVCFVISPGKSDIMEYFGGRYGPATIAYVVQPEPLGLCDAIFRAAPLIGQDDGAVVGLPDTIWFPDDALNALPEGFAFLLFPVQQPQFFDAVVLDAAGRVTEIQVKQAEPRSNWIWGAFRMPGKTLHDLHRLWQRPDRGDEFIGTLVNAWIAGGGEAFGAKSGTAYVDVGTFDGYRMAINLLGSDSAARMRAGNAVARGRR
jgi:glucose-1-phosphate thymidylyltransferase